MITYKIIKYITNFIINIKFLFYTILISFFITNFIIKIFFIPTNSMYPNFHGKKCIIYTCISQLPNTNKILKRYILLGSKHNLIKSDLSGNVNIKINSKGELIFNTKKLLYNISNELILLVNKIKINIKFPIEFEQIEYLISKIYFFKLENNFESIVKYSIKNRFLCLLENEVFLKTNKNIKKNETLFAFDILNGDFLLGNLFIYKIINPNIGDCIIFYNKNIRNLNFYNKINNKFFFLKRLIAISNYYIEFKSFLSNIKYKNLLLKKNKINNVYYPKWSFDIKEKLIIPKNFYYYLGDNSLQSLDSRFFGFVNKKSIVGKLSIIFYPINRIFK